jgi:hypothetical protein
LYVGDEFYWELKLGKKNINLSRMTSLGMVISTFVYLIGVVGGVGGLIATMGGILSIRPHIGLVILLTSIALLWIGVLLESVEESYISTV